MLGLGKITTVQDLGHRATFLTNWQHGLHNTDAPGLNCKTNNGDGDTGYKGGNAKSFVPTRLL